MGGHHPDRQRTTPLHPKAWSRRNPTLVILSICIFVQTIFIILSKSNITTTHGNLQTGLNLNNKNADNHLEKVKNDETNPKNLPSKAQQSKHPYPYAKTLEETVTNPKRQVKEFERQNDAVIVTKIHGRHNLITLEQSLCLLHYAYNQRLQYNIIVFYSDDLDEKDMITSRKIVKPVNISFVKDTPPLQEVLITLPEKRRQNLLTRCQAKKPNITLREIDWWTECPGRINYNWQAEFRSWHLWRHPALANYKYMMWLDSDGFPTRAWDRDPIAFAINNDLVLFAAAYHKQDAGKFGGEEAQRRIFNSFNTTLCDAYERDGTPHVISVTSPDKCFFKKLFNFHGYFHVTNLHFYRSDMVDRFSRNWIGDCFLCREYDDQAALTAPTLVLAPERAWTMTMHNFSLGVFHNSILDGKKAGGFIKLWNSGNNGITIPFEEARGNCQIKAGN
mmetsp:Transcript_16290/g.34089  ORF Transcript_16290/g.34089 Transcript_16290/m.34089 type:complete len:447 (+) Transcript_16290:173-1513(+)|eukprot:CAMPEP_0171377406 /NCGR_PEP_ID=MMETSP0879-20121228/21016_1 /TAXON_ID=67004 /ORGANISM="Thalassiosira weissflogii, Strain CCMP1336" /LENGTH=446 /DNA_ID=CAMNT_0011887515 /DNA_START=65 /DNA_END=1405 /DNA_ORIENTATION=-